LEEIFGGLDLRKFLWEINVSMPKEELFHDLERRGESEENGKWNHL
jgi:hypothetical protein